jgi:hypothetical protein
MPSADEIWEAKVQILSGTIFLWFHKSLGQPRRSPPVHRACRAGKLTDTRIDAPWGIRFCSAGRGVGYRQLGTNPSCVIPLLLRLCASQRALFGRQEVEESPNRGKQASARRTSFGRNGVGGPKQLWRIAPPFFGGYVSAAPSWNTTVMPQHIGIVACSAEGAALCYRTICEQGAQLLGPHAHPEVSMHTPSLAEYMKCIYRGDWQGVGELMLSSANKLAKIGADS